jgi:membrane-bound inhibitor of C-type lysozyme
MKYTLWALGNGATTTNTQTYTATGEGGLSLSYTVTKSVSSKDQILGQDYVKYCDVANGQGTRYAVGQYAYFYIHR